MSNQWKRKLFKVFFPGRNRFYILHSGNMQIVCIIKKKKTGDHFRQRCKYPNLEAKKKLQLVTRMDTGPRSVSTHPITRLFHDIYKTNGSQQWTHSRWPINKQMRQTSGRWKWTASSDSVISRHWRVDLIILHILQGVRISYLAQNISMKYPLI